MTYQLDPQLLAQLEELAEQQGREVGDLLQEAVLLYLRQMGVAQPELHAQLQQKQRLIAALKR